MVVITSIEIENKISEIISRIIKYEETKVLKLKEYQIHKLT